MAGVDTLNRVRYASFDFHTAYTEGLARLQVEFAVLFNDFALSSLGILLLDSTSYALDSLSFYLDRRATDMYLATARSRRSVALLTRQLGYKMAGAVAASVDLKVSTKQLYGFSVPIPQGFKFKGPGDAIFEAAQTVTIPPSSLTAVTVPCYQGQTVSETFTSDGTKNQTFRLAKVPANHVIVQGTVQVIVNGSPFTESEFLTFNATDQFEIGYNDDPPTLRFGDGTAGNIPVRGGSINVTYVATLGSAGRCISGTITKESSPLVVMAQPIGLVINNPLATVSGSDLEELDHAKTYAPRVFKSRRVAITGNDYEALAGSFVDPLFGRVAVAQAICARSAANDLELQNLLTDIRTSLTLSTTAIQNALSTGVTGAFDRVLALKADIQSAQDALTGMLAKLSTINTNMTSTLASARSVKSNAGELNADYADGHAEAIVAKNNLTTLRGTLAGLPTGTPSQLTSGDSTAILASIDGLSTSLNKIDALMGLMGSLASSMSASADSQTTVMNLAQGSLLVDVGIDATVGFTEDLQNAITAAFAEIGSTSLPYSALSARLHEIDDQTSLNQTAILTATQGIYDHVDSILAADCEANLVVVPILARDASGFYAAPSNGLIRTLQQYLDGIKEVTHSVRVTSGVGFLVPAAISVRIGVRVGISEQVTASSAETIVDGVLRDRAFGESLYVSDLDTPLRTLPGVSFVNVTIDGYVVDAAVLTDKLDAQGNLIVDSSQVITLSIPDLQITTEVVTS